MKNKIKQNIKSLLTAGLIFAALAGGVKSCNGCINKYEEKLKTQYAVLNSLDLKDKLELHRRMQDGFKGDELFANLALSDKLKSFEEAYKKDADNHYWLKHYCWYTFRDTSEVKRNDEWERITNVAEGRYNYCGKEYIAFEALKELHEGSGDGTGTYTYSITNLAFYDVEANTLHNCSSLLNNAYDKNKNLKSICNARSVEQKKVDSLNAKINSINKEIDSIVSAEQVRLDSLKKSTKLQEKVDTTYSSNMIKG